jgi:hypothetical protein
MHVTWAAAFPDLKNQTDSVWYNGLICTVLHDDTLLEIYAEGEVRVIYAPTGATLRNASDFYRLGFICDADLRSSHLLWESNNWFAIYSDGEEIAHSLPEAIQKAGELILRGVS